MLFNSIRKIVWNVHEQQQQQQLTLEVNDKIIVCCYP